LTGVDNRHRPLMRAVPLKRGGGAKAHINCNRNLRRALGDAVSFARWSSHTWHGKTASDESKHVRITDMSYSFTIRGLCYDGLNLVCDDGNTIVSYLKELVRSSTIRARRYDWALMASSISLRLYKPPASLRG
jgi:hypothetical protein